MACFFFEVEISLDFLGGVASEADAEFLEYLMVDFAKHHSGMSLTTVELREGLKSLLAVFIMSAEHRQSHEHLIAVQTGIMALQVGGLGVLNRFDHILRNKFEIMVDTGEMFHYV